MIRQEEKTHAQFPCSRWHHDTLHTQNFFFNHTHTYNKTNQAQDQAVDEKPLLTETD